MNQEIVSTGISLQRVSNLTSLTDSVANTTSYIYDNLDRVTDESNALGFSRLFQYDAVGNVTQITDRDGRIRQFSFDALDRLTSEVWVGGGNTLGYNYDSPGRLLSASDSFSDYIYTYDILDRMTSSDNTGTPNTPAVLMDFSYDLNGQRTLASVNVNGTDDYLNRYVWDKTGRITQILQLGQSGGNTVTNKRIDLAYNAAGQFTQVTRYEDLSGFAMVADSTYGYDSAGRLSSLTHDLAGTGPTRSYTWSYDALSRLTSTSNSDGSSTFTYDDTSQLLSATHSYQTDETYSYDVNGNRTITGYTTGTNNQLLSDGTYNYTYDGEGNRTRKTDIATGDYVDYAWDFRNRLTSVTFKDSLGTMQKQVAYTYDVNNRLIGRQYDSDGNGTFDEALRFVYDGANVVLVYDDAGSLENRFLNGPGVDQVFASEDALGAVLWALGDSQGTVRDVVSYDSTTDEATIANHRQFDSYGNITSETDPNVDFLFAYTGKFFDEVTGLQNNLNRWYDAAIGRWLSEDPIGFNAGDTSLVRMVGNGPTNATDPSGLESSQQITFTTHSDEFLVRGDADLLAEGLDLGKSDRFFELLNQGAQIQSAISDVETQLAQLEESRTWFGIFQTSKSDEQIQLESALVGLQLQFQSTRRQYFSEGFGSLNVEGFSQGFGSDMHRHSRGGVGFVRAVEAVLHTMTRTGAGGLQEAEFQPGDFIPVGLILKSATKASFAWYIRKGACEGKNAAGKFLARNWHKGTFPNRLQSVAYHLSQHGLGRTAVKYTQDAMQFFKRYKHLGKKVILKDGTPGIRIQQKIIDAAGKSRKIGGYWTEKGKLVTYWD